MKRLDFAGKASVSCRHARLARSQPARSSTCARVISAFVWCHPSWPTTTSSAQLLAASISPRARASSTIDVTLAIATRVGRHPLPHHVARLVAAPSRQRPKRPRPRGRMPIGEKDRAPGATSDRLLRKGRGRRRYLTQVAPVRAPGRYERSNPWNMSAVASASDSRSRNLPQRSRHRRAEISASRHPSTGTCAT